MFLVKKRSLTCTTVPPKPTGKATLNVNATWGSMKATLMCSAWNDLLDHLHPGLHPIGLGGVSRGSTGPQPGNDHAAHLTRLGRRRCRHHAHQGRQRERSREEVQLLWQEKIELSLKGIKETIKRRKATFSGRFSSRKPKKKDKKSEQFEAYRGKKS